MKENWTYSEISAFTGITITALRNRAMNWDLPKRYAERKPMQGKAERVFNWTELLKLLCIEPKTEILPVYKKVLRINQEFRVVESKMNYLP